MKIIIGKWLPLLSLLPLQVFAQEVDAPAGGVNIAANFSVLFTIAQAVSIVVGFFLFANSLYGIYNWSKSGGNGNSIGSSIGGLLIGTFLVSIGWFYSLFKGVIVGSQEGGVSMSGGQSHLALDADAIAAAQTVVQSGFGKFIPAGTAAGILAFIFFIGFVAFISGVYSLKDVGDQRGQNPVLSPVVKIIGGVICMNILWFSCLVSSLLGIPALCSGG